MDRFVRPWPHLCMCVYRPGSPRPPRQIKPAALRASRLRRRRHDQTRPRILAQSALWQRPRGGGLNHENAAVLGDVAASSLSPRSRRHDAEWAYYSYHYYLLVILLFPPLFKPVSQSSPVIPPASLPPPKAVLSSEEKDFIRSSSIAFLACLKEDEKS